jgi:hypothetical protein
MKFFEDLFSISADDAKTCLYFQFSFLFQHKLGNDLTALVYTPDIFTHAWIQSV